jgi:hypothetical protein
MMPSEPGRFSITTGWPQRLESASPNMRAPMSCALPGPWLTMKRTERCGQD